MSISVFPVPVTSSLNVNSLTAASANTAYRGKAKFTTGTYTVTCVSGTIATCEFYSGATLVTTAVTSSGTVTVNLATECDSVNLWTNTGTNVIVSISKTANLLINGFSGTLETLTTVGSSTYTGTSTSGYAYVVAVGGGGGGGAGTGAGRGAGGGSGAICEKLITLTGSLAINIGAAGTGGVDGVNSGTGVTGGTTTIAGMSAGGGGGGTQNTTVGAGGTATGGTYNIAGAAGGAGSAGTTGAVGTATAFPTYKFVVNGTTGSGAGARNNPAGGGSGIGTGGIGSTNTTGGNATGYGAGGGGGDNNNANNPGGNGSQGVIYVLKF